MMSGTGKKVLASICILVMGTVIAVFVGEVILRIVSPQPLYSFEKGLFADSEQYGYCLTPNIEKVHSQPEYSYSIRSNSYGFRGKEPDFNAELRILIVGDSFGMGQGVKDDEVLSRIAQEYFDKQGIDIDIFNASVSGYGPVNYYKVINEIVPNYKPQLVILLLCWNDIGFDTSLKVKDGYLVIKDDESRLNRLREWLNNNSHLFCLIKRFYYILKIKLSAQRDFADTEYSRTTIQKTVETLSDMNRFCRANGARFIVVMTPLESAYSGTHEFLENKEMLLADLKAARIENIDWGKVLPETNREDLIYRIDHHWNKEGHAYFSDNVIDIINKDRGSQ